jgi:hypothetical protein
MTDEQRKFLLQVIPLLHYSHMRLVA